jgi:Fic family protein
MEISKLIEELDILKKELKALLPMKQEHQRTLDDKYRLEWNFNSNRIEGNTLTYGQTKMLLFFGKATGEHEKRDYDEMEAHDVAIKMVKEWANDKERELVETDLRTLNEIILVKPFYKVAITEDGQSTRKIIVPGQYKQIPNSVRLRSGQIHHYASPEDTPILMKELFNEYSKFSKKHPISVAIATHHEFTAIHPFDDGNGRVARLWTNYILLKYGYPPLIVRAENKNEYLTALQKGDIGDLEPLSRFFTKELKWSLNLSIRAAKGESIDEPGDLDKKISLLDKELEKDPHPEIKLHRKNLDLKEVFINEMYPLMKAFSETQKKFEHLFYGRESNLTFKLDSHTQKQAPFEKWQFPTAFNSLEIGKVNECAISLRLKGFKKAGTKPFDVATEVIFNFDEFGYKAHYINQREQLLIDKLYDQNLSEEEIRVITDGFGNWILEQIKDRRKNWI